ncbi:MAG TPA: histidine kinase [Mycobacteriales bacterium]|jgi:signal transduction histidine kinase|nr:histidine kinase [Mycobacteriales bacterium]
MAEQAEYVQASRLLTQLRTIARQLPGTLDPGGIAEHLLDELRTIIPADRAAAFITSGGGRLEVLAQSGQDRSAWETSLDIDSPIAEAWTTQEPALLHRSMTRLGEDDRAVRPATGVVLPLVTGVRTVGLIVLEGAPGDDQPDPDQVKRAAAVTRDTALRLETALLFDEVRSLATTQERQRLAREIHDGIAQELVIVGYALDNAIAGLGAEPPEHDSVTQQLHTLRAEITRMITELRLSLFELRSDVDRHGGLGSAIAEYARTVGTTSGLRVHVSLGESTARLPAAVESELLRIAQEAMNNARKHAKANNLWVTCDVDPPRALLQISDDGGGMSTTKRRKDSYGMSIMAERAERIRASLSVENREPHGTVVSVSLRGD